MLGIVIVNYGSPKHTLELLSVLYSNFESQEVIFLVVDNASEDKNFQVLENFIKKCSHKLNIRLVRTEKNLGFSGGNNVGIRNLLKYENITHIWLLNNDTILNGNSIANAMNYIKTYPNDILGATLLYYHNNLVQCLGGARFDHLLLKGKDIGRGLSIDKALSLDEDTLSERIDYINGASLIIPANFLRKEGLLDESYFLYYEEIDLSKRFEKYGKLRWCKNIIVLHKEGKTINNISYEQAKSELAEFHTIRSSIIFAKKWYRHRAIFPIFIRLLSKILINFRSKRYHLISTDFRGFISGVSLKHEKRI